MLLRPNLVCRTIPILGLCLFAAPLPGITPLPGAQEWLTAEEIARLRDQQELPKRVEFYMKAARLRLETAQKRLQGESSPAGDPFEFHSHTELVQGCRMAIRAAMLNIQDQVSYRKLRGPELNKSLGELKKECNSLLPKLEELEKAAIERLDEPLYRAVRDCLEFARSAIRGAEQALDRDPPEKPSGKKP